MSTGSKILFNSPAESWNEALPIGNGRLGGMVFGKPYTEIIQLNEDSVWSGGPKDRNNRDALKNLPEIRKLIFEGRIKEAEDLCAFALSGTPEEQSHYEPMGNLYIHFDGDEDEITDYCRFLDIEAALAETSFKRKGITYKRQVIASYPDGVLAIRITADKKGAINFHTQIARGPMSWDYRPYKMQILRNPNYNSFIDRCEVTADNTVLMTAQCGGKGATELFCAVTAVAEGGSVSTLGNSVVVRDADSATVLLSCCTTFYEKEPEQSVLEKINQAALLSWEELLIRHTDDYKALYDNVKLELEEDNCPTAALPTPERLAAYKKNADDNKLIELLFNFGRYLLISCSRPGSLPANLQGIWNTDLIPAWGSKYTININTQMNYWPAEVCGLSECHMPLIDHIERMRENGRRTARVMYDCGGFVAHHNTDLWGDTAPQDACLCSTYWVMGAAWLCLHIWEHYRYTDDTEFLKRYYPTMLEAAEFLADYLVEDGEYLVTCPTLSPENSYRLPNGEQGVICKAASMDNQIIQELFTACITAADILGVQDGMTQRLKDTLKRIAPVNIGKYGQIMEWNEDYDEVEPGHRHISQLFALHPGTQISVNRTPKLAKAAKATLERRLSHGGGHTGWSRAWIINMWARLREGELALYNVKELLKHSVLPNLFDDHPPFQIDGNFGSAAGIAEMLIQSHEDKIILLPALPDEWKNGSVKGLRARGGYIVDIVWKDGLVSDYTVYSKNKKIATVEVNGEMMTVDTKA